MKIFNGIVNGIIIFNLFARNFLLIFVLLTKIKSYLTLEHRALFYNAYIHVQPQFNYCNIISGNAFNYNVSKFTKLRRRACKNILKNEYEGLESARKNLNTLSFDQNVLLTKQKLCTSLQMDEFRSI